MNILIIGKYPPIQGGVSTQMYWSTKKLSQHINIDILTNSFEVESMYREDINLLDKEYNHSNKINIYSTNKFELPNFIPIYNPIDLKLINLGIQLIENKRYDLIYGDYLLPYCFVANYLSKKYNIPYVIGHAGSDMTRLLYSKHYNNLLTAIIKETNGIITYPGGKRLFSNYLNNQEILESQYGVPIAYFNIYAKKDYDLAIFKNVNPRYPIYLHTGKLAHQKGIFELIDAFSKVNFKYNLIFIGNGRHKNKICKYAKEKKVNLLITDFVPPWVIPKLISKCDYFLSVECNFGVDIHAPIAFIEAMSLGKICILSTQLKNLPPKDTCLEVDPTNLSQYTSILNYSNKLSAQEYNLISKNAKSFVKRANLFENNILDKLDFFKKVIAKYNNKKN